MDDRRRPEEIGAFDNLSVVNYGYGVNNHSNATTTAMMQMMHSPERRGSLL